MRGPVAYFGGKARLSSKLLPLIPRLRIYCEPYGGGGSILCARDPAPVEIFNDLNGDLINLFRALQDPERFTDLKHRLTHTLYSREELASAIEILGNETGSPEERAWAFFVSLNQGFGGMMPTTDGQWGRAFTSSGGMAGTAKKWLLCLSLLDDWHKRFSRVQIDCKNALEVIAYWDSPDTSFYLDPPYVADTRVTKNVYAKECTDRHHRDLVYLILEIKGAVVISGYAHHTYTPLERAGWERTNIDTVCTAAVSGRKSGLQGKGAVLAKVPRTETIWRNPKAVELTAPNRIRSRGLDTLVACYEW